MIKYNDRFYIFVELQEKVDLSIDFECFDRDIYDLLILHFNCITFIVLPFSPPNWHTEGDGADDNDNQNKSKYRFDHTATDDLDDDFNYSNVPPERSVVIAGQEDYFNHHVPFDDPRAMQQWYTSMQRRLTILENEQDYQNRLSNVWKYFLLTLTIVNPFIVNYFFFKRR